MNTEVEGMKECEQVQISMWRYHKKQHQNIRMICTQWHDFLEQLQQLAKELWHPCFFGKRRKK
jgi:hypothetical protein